MARQPGEEPFELMDAEGGRHLRGDQAGGDDQLGGGNLEPFGTTVMIDAPLRAVRRGENMTSGREDWESIVRTHAPLAFDAAWRLLGHAADTEDVVQEALLDAFRLHLRQPVDNWAALIRHLATRRAIDSLRNRRTASLPPLDTFDVPAPASEQPESFAAERELADRLRWAIAELSDREASVFSLRYFGELANGEIALTLGISTDAVGVALHKATKRLKELLGLQARATRSPRS